MPLFEIARMVAAKTFTVHKLGRWTVALHYARPSVGLYSTHTIASIGNRASSGTSDIPYADRT